MSDLGLKKPVPCWMRIWLKIVLARLPIPYGVWKRFQFFEHGDMNQPQSVFDIFLELARLADVLDVKSHLQKLKVAGNECGVLELSSGNSIFSAVIARASLEGMVPRIVCWDNLPLSRLALDVSFYELSDEELLVNDFDMVLTCAA